VSPGIYDTHAKKAKIVVNSDGKAVLVRDGKEVPHRVEKQGDVMVVVATDSGEAFKPLLSSGQEAVARTTPIHGANGLQYEQRREEWERQRAELMKKAEGARQHAQEMLKEARAKASATAEKQ
jgi:hypothetical protein